MTVNEAVNKVMNLLGNDVKNKCYVASEAIYHLAGGKSAGLKPMNMKHEGSSHWYLEHNGVIIDVTSAQFKSIPDYTKARGRGFLTKEPSKRTRLFLGM